MPYLMIWFLAVAVRAIYLWQIHEAPVFTMLLGDAASYDAWARQIAGGDWLGKGVFYQAPLYPYFLGSLYALLGTNLLWTRLVQMLVGATSCVLLARAGRSFFSEKVGLLAGAVLALYPTAVFFDCSIQKSVLDLFFVCALLATLGRLHTRSERRWWGIAGCVLGLLTLTRENALVLLPIVVTWLFVTWRGEPGRERFRWAGSFLAGLAMVLLPVAFRNLAVGGEFHLTTAQFGPNFYIGNGSSATSIYRPLAAGRGSAEFERVDAARLAEQGTGRKLTAGEVSRYWTTRTFEEIRANPARWLCLMGRKSLLVWNISEIGDSEDQYTYGNWSPLLRILNRVLHFGTICPVALFGICVTWPQRKRLWLLYAITLGYAASVVVFFVFSRYRFPIVPLLVLFSATGLICLPEVLRTRQWRTLAVGFAIATAAACITNRPMFPEARIRAATHFNVAFALEQQGKPESAIVHYTEATRLAPNDAEAHAHLGELRMRAGETNAALDHYERAVRIRPDFATAHHNFGNALLHVGKAQQAIEQYELALRSSPDSADIHTCLGIALAQTGEYDAAIAEYEKALQIDPTLAEAHNSLGIALSQVGKVESAIGHFDQALRIKPDFAEAHYNLGNALARVGRVREAIEHYERAVQLRPDFASAKTELTRLCGAQ